MLFFNSRGRGGNTETSSLVMSLIVSASFLCSAGGQELTPKLTEGELRSVIPVLKAEIAGYERLEKGINTERAAQQALFDGIKSGRIDPLKWLQQRSKYVVVPPGAVYEPACSRAVSIMGWDSPGRQDPEVAGILPPPVLPKAIFTFGKEIPAVNKHLLGRSITNESYARFRENPYTVDDPSYKEIRSILGKARAFYNERGFSASYSMDGYTVDFYPSDAEGEIAGVVWQVHVELFDPANPDVVKNSKSHPLGPSIEIKAGDKLMEKALKSGNAELGASDAAVKRDLQKAGISEERYAEIKAALVISRIGSQNPEEEEPAAFEMKASTPEERQAAQEIEKMRKEVRVRKNNISLYRRYKAELDPILDALQKYLGIQ